LEQAEAEQKAREDEAKRVEDEIKRRQDERRRIEEDAAKRREEALKAATEGRHRRNDILEGHPGFGLDSQLENSAAAGLPAGGRALHQDVTFKIDPRFKRDGQGNPPEQHFEKHISDEEPISDAEEPPII